MTSRELSQRIFVSLAGPFRMWTDSGQDVSVSGVMSRRLIAVLLLSNDMSRSRYFLQNLLWDENRNDPQGSLRQLLSMTRTRLGAHQMHLVADGTSVRLVGVENRTERTEGVQEDFFEDAGIGTDAFEQWHQVERAAFERLPARPQEVEQVRQSCPRPTVGISVATAEQQNDTAHALGAWVADQIRDVFVQNAFVEVRDLRMGRNAQDVDMELRISVHREAISICGFHAGACKLSKTKRIKHAPDQGYDDSQVAAFVYQTASVVERIAIGLAKDGQGGDTPAQLFDAVSLLFSSDQADIIAALRALQSMTEPDIGAQALVWQAYGHLILTFEFGAEAFDGAIERVTRLLGQAMDQAPDDPSVMSIAALFRGIGLGDSQRGMALSDEALEVAPFSPLARHVRAVLLMHAGELERASPHVRLALRMGRYGPMRHRLAANEMMLAALSGEFTRAVSLGRALLHVQPENSNALVHMIPSLLEVGCLDEAHEAYDTLRKVCARQGKALPDDPVEIFRAEISRKAFSDVLERHGFPDARFARLPVRVAG